MGARSLLIAVHRNTVLLIVLWPCLLGIGYCVCTFFGNSLFSPRGQVIFIPFVVVCGWLTAWLGASVASDTAQFSKSSMPAKQVVRELEGLPPVRPV
jgi:NO-binding membrane sensor protein with MHYT domain